MNAPCFSHLGMNSFILQVLFVYLVSICVGIQTQGEVPENVVKPAITPVMFRHAQKLPLPVKKQTASLTPVTSTTSLENIILIFGISLGILLLVTVIVCVIVKYYKLKEVKREKISRINAISGLNFVNYGYPQNQWMRSPSGIRTNTPFYNSPQYFNTGTLPFSYIGGSQNSLNIDKAPRSNVVDGFLKRFSGKKTSEPYVGYNEIFEYLSY